MIFRLPWAKREHTHLDSTLSKYTVCSGCGHLILMGHIRNKIVRVLDRSSGGTIEWNEIYSESCAPQWDTKEIAIDCAVRYYSKGKEVGDGE